MPHVIKYCLFLKVEIASRDLSFVQNQNYTDEIKRERRINPILLIAMTIGSFRQQYAFQLRS